MRASKFTIPLFLLAAVAAGCDNISEDDRYIKVEKPVVENPRTLLIMEFTGNRCVNCPVGAAEIESIKADEGADRVIAVGLHPKGDPNTRPIMSMHPVPHMQDFCTDVATSLYNYYKPSGFPTAVFNGTEMSGSINAWMGLASQALQVPARMSVAAGCDYDSETGELTVNYKVEFGNVISDELNLSVWLVENHIMGTQMMPNGSQNRDYEHNHVLRCSLNGDAGQTIVPKGATVDSGSAPVEGSVSMSFCEADPTANEAWHWVPENCEVVVYVYRVSDHGVEQAAKAPVVPAASED